jgi:hypothetical protein
MGGGRGLAQVLWRRPDTDPFAGCGRICPEPPGAAGSWFTLVAVLGAERR